MKDRLCRCGHPQSEHKRSWGPNSIGQYGHGLCRDGWKSVHGYLFQKKDSCQCGAFRRRWLPRFRRA